MPSREEDSPRLRQNLKKVLCEIRDSSRRRVAPSIETARAWHKDTMAGLDVPGKEYVGGFRGEGGALKHCRVWIGGIEGVPPEQVANALKAFELRLQRVIKELDNSCKRGADLDADGLAGVIEVAAWAHAQWVRIHPFANGSGRTARLWANSILMRYGLPPVVKLRPRPDGSYGNAAAKAMKGEWEPTFIVFREMLLDYLRRDAP